MRRLILILVVFLSTTEGFSGSVLASEEAPVELKISRDLGSEERSRMIERALRAERYRLGFEIRSDCFYGTNLSELAASQIIFLGRVTEVEDTTSAETKACHSRLREELAQVRAYIEDLTIDEAPKVDVADETLNRNCGAEPGTTIRSLFSTYNVQNGIRPVPLTARVRLEGVQLRKSGRHEPVDQTHEQVFQCDLDEDLHSCVRRYTGNDFLYFVSAGPDMALPPLPSSIPGCPPEEVLGGGAETVQQVLAAMPDRRAPPPRPDDLLPPDIVSISRAAGDSRFGAFHLVCDNGRPHVLVESALVFGPNQALHLRIGSEETARPQSTTLGPMELRTGDTGFVTRLDDPAQLLDALVSGTPEIEFTAIKLTSGEVGRAVYRATPIAVAQAEKVRRGCEG